MSAASPELPWRVVPGGIELAVRATPRAGRSEAAGFVADAQGRSMLHLRLAAPPVEGAANDALIAFLAAELGLRKRDVTIRSGESSRMKMVAVSGDAVDLDRRLRLWLIPARG